MALGHRSLRKAGGDCDSLHKGGPGFNLSLWRPSNWANGSLILALGLAEPALAQGIDQRQENQQQRIASRIGDGSLTAFEAARLQRGQAWIAREEQRFRADENLRPWERAKLHRDLNRASRRIWYGRHNWRWRR
ncbi:MAG: hypothetical protein HY713_04740 [candidate division NC10 bacterium]|nr:hypothetical protein [candidate division NC10 bacterium]